MTQVYNVFDGSDDYLYRTLKEAHDHIKEHNPSYWRITRHTIVRPTIDNMIKIITEKGGAWSLEETFVAGS